MDDFPRPPFPDQSQPVPGATDKMQPRPDHGEDSYQGSGRLKDKKVLITGADSGIGRAVAIAFAREGADLLVSYLDEEEDARETHHLVEAAGRTCVLMAGELVDRAVAAFGRRRVGQQRGAPNEFRCARRDFQRGMGPHFCRQYLGDVLPGEGGAAAHEAGQRAIINTASINADCPSPHLLVYATTKGAIQNFTAGLAQMLAEKNIRVNAVAPGTVWTPLIPSTMPAEAVRQFGEQVPMKRPAQPRELAPVYVMLASDEASYVSGTMIGVTGGKPIL